MSMNRPSTVVGVFRDRTMAEQAMAALKDAGFSREQIRYAGPGGGGNFFEDIKSLFTAPGATADNLVHDLAGMGLSDDEARYYAGEYQSGHTIIAVKAPGREQEAMDVMNRYGTYNYGPTSTPGAAASAGYTPAQQPVNTPLGNYAAPQPAQTGSNYPPTPDNQLAPSNQPSPDNQPVTPASQPTAAPTGHNTELEQLQAQIQETRRQLEDARARLQAAKDRENQIQSARQELQQVQSELQSTLAELHDTEARVG